MSTRHVILGLIGEQPSHTYDVAVRFGKRLDPWQVNRGQVYRTVASLESDGLIEATDRKTESKRSGPSWRLTASGVEEFDRWFATLSDEVEPLRGELLAKLAVAEPRHTPELLIALDWYERALTTRLAADVRARQANIAASGWQKEIADCIADGAILHRDAELIWVRRVRETVQGWAKHEIESDRRESGRQTRAS